VEAPAVGLVDQLLQLDVEHRRIHVEQGRDAPPDLGDQPGVLRGGSKPGQQQGVAGRKVMLRARALQMEKAQVVAGQ
jgi:hypothetical protein